MRDVHADRYPRLRELLDDGAQLVEVLPDAEHAEEHLPGGDELLDLGEGLQHGRPRPA